MLLTSKWRQRVFHLLMSFPTDVYLTSRAIITHDNYDYTWICSCLKDLSCFLQHQKVQGYRVGKQNNIWRKLALQYPLLSRRAVCFLGWSCFTCAAPLALAKSRSPPHQTSPDPQTLTRCTEFTDDSLIKPHFVDTDFRVKGKEREKKTWRPKVSSQKSHLFCWLNSCRMTCGSSCLIVIRASVRRWAHSISPY